MIKNFNKNKFDESFTCLIIGSSKSGKSTQTNEIIKDYFPDSKYIIVYFCENFNSKPYKELEKKKIIFTSYCKNNIFIKLAYSINLKTDNKFKFLFVFDDIVINKSDNTIKQQFLSLRNSGISTIMNVQSDTITNKINRNNTNMIFFKHQNTDIEIKDTIERYLISYFNALNINNMNDMISFYKNKTDNYNYFYINNLTNEIFFYNNKNAEHNKTDDITKK